MAQKYKIFVYHSFNIYRYKFPNYKSNYVYLIEDCHNLIFYSMQDAKDFIERNYLK